MSPKIEIIECPKCDTPTPAPRAGTQDDADVYVCKHKHITRIKIGFARREWIVNA